MHLQLHGGCYDRNLKLLFLYLQIVLYIPSLTSYYKMTIKPVERWRHQAQLIIVISCHQFWTDFDSDLCRKHDIWGMRVDVLDERHNWGLFDKLPCCKGIITCFEIFTKRWSLFCIFLNFLAALQFWLWPSVSVLLQGGGVVEIVAEVGGAETR